jgi:alcohol dehydrogenase
VNDAPYHHVGCAAFAELAVVSRRSTVKIDRSLPRGEAELFGGVVLVFLHCFRQ